ncbi:Tubulin-specific chaperone cofactor E-like protein [Halotydeus destructor]|nr:Tubulin-specific chaperone cofactor E-like protein [Halotydeus destructor]
MPQLTELRCQGLAVLDTINDVEARRHHLIARLPNVQILNGSEVSPDERLFAEKAFIRWHITNDHVEKPPKFYELRDIHGKVDPVAELSLAPRKYAKVTVESSLNCPEEVSGSPSDSDSSNDASSRTRTLELKLDLNKSVKEFKQQLSTIFNHPASQMKLFYVDRDMEGFFGPEEMRFAEKRLYTYSIQDGDKFIVDPK